VIPARYLALIAADGLTPAASAAGRRAAEARELERVHAGEQLLLFATPGAVPLAPAGRGIAIGTLVADRHGGAALGEEPWPDAMRRFAATHWGDYVLFRPEPRGRAITVLRAPCATLGALTVSRDGMTVLTSDLDLLEAATGARQAIDWLFVAHHLGFPHLRTGRTGLAGVAELRLGESLRFAPEGVQRALAWTPWRFAAADRQVEDRREACDMVRDAVARSVAALVPSGRTVLLELSGGLDSSILAAALAAAGRDARAVNLVTPAAEGDERRYARATAAACGLDLAELAIGDMVDLTVPAGGRLPRPGIPAMLAPADRLLADHARACGAAAFVSGTGGDCVFCSPASAAPAADALRRFGIGHRFLRAAAEIAAIHQATAWQAGRMAWRQARRPPLHRWWPRTETFLRRDAVPQEPEPHPWLAEPEDALPGRRSHIRSILASFAHLDGYARHALAPSVFPLLSQPVIEACLRVPTWLWIAGGRDRSVARGAYRDLLPALVVDRRAKGGMDSYCVRAFEANRAALRPFLLDGHLAGAGLIDHAAIETYLRRSPDGRDDRFYRLLPIIDVERWLRALLG